MNSTHIQALTQASDIALVSLTTVLMRNLFVTFDISRAWGRFPWCDCTWKSGAAVE